MNVWSLARSIRPQATLLPWMLYTTALTAHKGLDVVALILGWVLLVVVYGIVVIQNDLADEAIDKANHRHDIPLVEDAVSPQQLQVLILTLTFVAVILGAYEGSGVLLWIAAYCLLGWLYSGSANLKGRGILALALLGISYGFMPWVLGVLMVRGTMNGLTLGMAVASAVFAAGIIALKDYKDEVGDRAAGKRTLLVRSGRQFVRHYIVAATSAAYILALILLATKGNSWGYLLMMAGGLAGIYSGMMLGDEKIYVPAYRAKYGRIARLLFYSYIVTAYLLVR